MFKRYTLVFFVILSVDLCTTGCVGDVDFEQTEDIDIQTQFDIDLVYFTLTPENFVGPDENLFATQVTQTTNVDFVREDFIQTNLARVDFDFEIDNAIEQDFMIDVRFLDREGREAFTFTLPIMGSEAGTPTKNILTQAVEGTDLINLKTASRMEVTLKLIENGMPITGSLVFRSKARYTFGL